MGQYTKTVIITICSFICVFSIFKLSSYLHSPTIHPVIIASGFIYPGDGIKLRAEVESVEKNRGALYTDEYKRIRRRYRFLEFFSLGFLLIMAVIVISYLLTVKQRSEEARKLIAETYSVEELLNPRAIKIHFQRLITDQTLFRVMFENREDNFHTTPMVFLEEDDVFQTEILSPPSGNRFLEDDSKVKIEYMFNEVLYSFITRPIMTSESKDKKITFQSPELIKYTQRRHDYRIKPPALEPVGAIFITPAGPRQESVLDLGTGGFSIRSEYDYQPGETGREVKLIIPGRKPVKIDSSCSYILPLSVTENEQIYRVGFKFENRGVKEEKTLMEYVSEVRQKKV